MYEQLDFYHLFFYWVGLAIVVFFTIRDFKRRRENLSPDHLLHFFGFDFKRFKKALIIFLPLYVVPTISYWTTVWPAYKNGDAITLVKTYMGVNSLYFYFQVGMSEETSRVLLILILVVLLTTIAISLKLFSFNKVTVIVSTIAINALWTFGHNESSSLWYFIIFVVGLCFSYALLRFGLVAAITVHFLYNSAFILNEKIFLFVIGGLDFQILISKIITLN